MRLSIFSLAICLLASPLAARADDTKDFLDPANWEGRKDLWKIEGGSIVGETKEDPKYNTFFCSKKKYADFEMSLKVRLRDGAGNSGVQIRSEMFGDDKTKPFRVKGPQVDMAKGYWGSLYGEGYSMMQAADGKLVGKVAKDTDWNEFHVIAKGDKITIKLNGETTVDKEFPKMPGKDAKDMAKEGIIAFQVHAGVPKMKVEFSDIKFTILK